MQVSELDLGVSRLGECQVPSPMSRTRFVGDGNHVLYHSNLRDIEAILKTGKSPPFFEMAGPREKIFFDPSRLNCGIVTCGGLCPGLNDVIRAIVMGLFYHYGVRTVFGFRYGYEGLTDRYGHVPMELDPKVVDDIHQKGGTILGSSRGSQDISEMVDTLERRKVGLLFAIGGDGTLRGAGAIAEEIGRRNLKIGVIGIPKTIDNDISAVDLSFGFETAVSEARTAIYSAHTEARGARNGVGLVKLMGRESGFIAAYAALAYNDVNFCLIPEARFTLEAFLEALRQRLERRSHAVVVVAEGAGQDLMEKTGERDASGNVRFGDVGVFLRDRIREYFRKVGTELNLKYIDPSYTIRSVPANPHDSAFCLLLGHNAVHAGMAGRTDMVVGYWKSEFTHVPIRVAVSRRKQIDPNGRLWDNVLACTGQPREMV
ncbi:MAG: ATP-dependent 6-phosphofructokinase [Deltaproteobacteria bacterium]|nr:ATP-dependent 6-phosphofructokinase [Deltaproteobacteria bacterium]MBW2122478.1 ATP-dependent 6-phosphofructokinase [Deltaproteobacteria bacterium]